MSRKSVWIIGILTYPKIKKKRKYIIEGDGLKYTGRALTKKVKEKLIILIKDSNKQ